MADPAKSYPPEETEPIDPDRTVIDRGDKAEFVVRSNWLGGDINRRFARGDKIAREDLDVDGEGKKIPGVDFGRLVDVGALVPIPEFKKAQDEAKARADAEAAEKKAKADADEAEKKAKAGK